jgi:hypothetical protein
MKLSVTKTLCDGPTAKQDAVAYRRALLDQAPRAEAVLELAAEKAGWGQPLPERSAVLIALVQPREPMIISNLKLRECLRRL